jgi:hypothetical protein
MANNKSSSVLLQCDTCHEFFQAVTLALAKGRKCSALVKGQRCGGELKIAKPKRTEKEKRKGKK